MDRSTRSMAFASWAPGLLLAALAAGAGCGPTASTARIMDADVQLEAARAADAAKLAPYEFTAAEAYLKKAREEQGYADFEVSMDFGKKAVKLATEARAKAMAAKSEGALPNAPGIAPPPPPSREVTPSVDRVENVGVPEKK